MAESSTLNAAAKPFATTPKPAGTPLRASAPEFDGLGAEASNALAAAEMEEEQETFVLEQMIADTVVAEGQEEQDEANARLDAVSPSILPGTGKFDLNRSATEEEILEAGKLFVLESDIVETEREAAEEEIEEASQQLKQMDVQDAGELFVAENAVADAVIATGIEEQAEANSAVDAAFAKGVLKSRNVSVTDSEIQNAGELFEMEQEIAQLEEAVIQEETEKAHAGT